jgi:uncharacterized protein with HEPN domain
MSSSNRRGRAPTAALAIASAALAAERAMALVAHDTLPTYLANAERMDAMERILIRFGEALKAVPPDMLTAVSPTIIWSDPIRFRDLAAHWYEEGLDHELIWRVVKHNVPVIHNALCAWLEKEKS